MEQARELNGVVWVLKLTYYSCDTDSLDECAIIHYTENNETMKSYLHTFNIVESQGPDSGAHRLSAHHTALAFDVRQNSSPIRPLSTMVINGACCTDACIRGASSSATINT